MPEKPAPRPHPPGSDAQFTRRVLIVLGLVALAFLLWQLRQAVLLGFAAVVVAIVLLAASRPLERRTGLDHRWALAIVGLAVILVLALASWLVGARVQDQVSDLVSRLPQAWEQLRQEFGQLPASSENGGGMANGEMLSAVAGAAQGWTSRVLSYGYQLFDIVATFVLVIIGGAFLAAKPDLYRRGLLKLAPSSSRKKIGAALSDSGEALRLWILAQLMSMAIVGTLTGLGAWLIGLPAPLALGLLAGIAEFVPVVGAIVSAIPALLLAFSVSWSTVLWALLLYVAIQQLESNLVMPMIQQRMVTIPAGILLMAVFAFGILFGPLGIVIASPLAVVSYVMVNKLYLNDTLDEL